MKKKLALYDITNNRGYFRAASTQIELNQAYNYYSKKCNVFLVCAQSEEHFIMLIAVWNEKYYGTTNVPYEKIIQHGIIDVSAINNIGSIAFTHNVYITVIPLQ